MHSKIYILSNFAASGFLLPKLFFDLTFKNEKISPTLERIMPIKRFVVIFLTASVLYAESLESLLAKVAESPIYQSRIASIEAERYGLEAETRPDGWYIGTEGSYADLKDGSDSGREWGISIGRTFRLKGSAVEALFKRSEAYSRMRRRVALHRLRAKLWYLYRRYCLTYKTIEAKGELGVIYDEMARHIDKGVRFGEFDASKSIMAHLALENLNLQIAELDSRLKEYEAQIEAIVPFDGQFDCRPVRPDLGTLFEPSHSALWPMLNSRVDKAKEALSVASTRLPSMGVEGSYTDELDTRRYTLSLSIPLAFGAKSDAGRAAAMHTYEAARQELEAFKNRYAQQTRALKQRLDIYLRHVKSAERTIALSADTLIEQSRMRFKAGEESLIGMLKAAETKLQMIETILDLKQSRLEAVYRYLDEYAVDPQGVM